VGSWLRLERAPVRFPPGLPEGPLNAAPLTPRLREKRPAAGHRGRPLSGGRPLLPADPLANPGRPGSASAASRARNCSVGSVESPVEPHPTPLSKLSGQGYRTPGDR